MNQKEAHGCYRQRNGKTSPPLRDKPFGRGVEDSMIAVSFLQIWQFLATDCKTGRRFPKTLFQAGTGRSLIIFLKKTPMKVILLGFVTQIGIEGLLFH